MSTDERLSKDDILKLATDEFSYELKELIELFQSDIESEILTFFSNYDSFLKEKRSLYLGNNVFQTITKNNLIDTSD